jgi:metal-dependent amidase/aminoacylase/carboxypeptidase family protein
VGYTPSLAAKGNSPREVAQRTHRVLGDVTDLPELIAFYEDLHRHPELSGRETRTSSLVAKHLKASGARVATGIGGTGVVGIVANGDGPAVMLRADMDALLVEERTGFDYASTAIAEGADGNPVPVMHACGHDVHMAALVGTVRALARARDRWRGTIMAVAQPAEETAEGAQAMLRDGLFRRFGKPDVALAQHVDAFGVGQVGHAAGLSPPAPSTSTSPSGAEAAMARARRSASTRSSSPLSSCSVCRPSWRVSSNRPSQPS